jgi:hypothetical protein
VLAKRETQDVFRLRLAVLLVLVSSAIGAALTVYFYLTVSEETQFMHQFHEDTKKVFDEIGRGIDETMSAFDSMAVTLVSTANMTNQTWPFVTMADYAVRMSKVVPLTHAVVTNTYHVVKPYQRVQWENYTASNNGWVNEGMAVQKDWGKYYGPIEYNGEQPSTLYGTLGDVPMNIRYVRQSESSPQGDSSTLINKLTCRLCFLQPRIAPPMANLSYHTNRKSTTMSSQEAQMASNALTKASLSVLPVLVQL